MATLRLFAAARDAAGVGHEHIDESTVAAVLAVAVSKYGPTFESVLPSCRVWVNGEPADLHTAVGERDEVAVLPPVSGG
ncbi:MAG: MoaD/ThiS family protein [Actinomycetota bacterium]